MNEEEKFDKLLRFKLSEREFPFDELNWDDAEQLIIRKETRGKTIRFTMIFSAGIVAGALLMLPFMLNNRNTSSATIVTNSTTIQNSVAKNSSASSSRSTETNSTNITTTEKAPQPVQPAFVEKDIRTGAGGNSSQLSSVAIKTSRQHTASTVTSVNYHNRFSGNQTNGTPYLASAATLKSENALTNTHASGNVVSSPSYANTPENSAPPNVSDKAGETADEAKAVTNNISSNTVTNNTSVSNKNTTSDNTTPSNNIVLNNAPEANKDTATSNNPVSNNSVSDNTSESNKNMAIASTNNVTNKKDTISNDVLPPLLPGTTPRYIHSDYSSNAFSIYAGGDYSFGWKNEELAENGSAKQASGITPLGGIYYTHYFGNISASLGIGYSELNGLNKTYTSSVLQYDFGANENVTTVTPETVYYLAFPLKLQYDITSKDIVGINCNYLLMLTTSSTLTTYRQTYFNETVLSTEKQNGYTQGFSNSNWQLGLSYTRMLTGRFGATVELYHDLVNIENNSLSDLTQNTKNNGLRLILSYQLIH